MRPRSRQLSKRRLTLPTIREGTEEMVRDLNDANTLHSHSQTVSSEDYLLSICHLAHPTFATRDISRRGGTTLPTSDFSLEVEQEEEKDPTGAPMFGNSDPLEYLYGHHSNPSVLSGGARKGFVEGRFVRQRGRAWESRARTRAHSIPRASSPDLPRQRKSSCPELHTDTHTSSVPNALPTHTQSGSDARRNPPTERRAEEEYPAIKQSLISQWISDCRSAWREARLRACMLPAIAEV